MDFQADECDKVSSRGLGGAVRAILQSRVWGFLALCVGTSFIQDTLEWGTVSLSLELVC